MTLVAQLPAVLAAAMPLPHAGAVAAIYETVDLEQAEVAAPFGMSAYVNLSSTDLFSVFLHDQHFVSSSANANSISVTVQAPDRTPAEMTQEFKRISGLTWAQVATVFRVAARTTFNWTSGEPVNAKNHEKLGLAVAAIRFIDRGSVEENRNLLLSEAAGSQSYLDLFRAGEFDRAQELAGEGAGRPNLGHSLTADAAKFNVPHHFGESIEAAADLDETEILPISKPKIRRAKARRNKA
ncbi:hypothetical protein [Leisingera sp. NJS204]|uniref:hypothetical protein n=1 Tax=Leisingera sp. NJS204 TaxID=2508307 RepID=UPI0010106AAE|nr:hypothetical protein [Leisingera sp. NJS204]QAX31323.1 hypothetical protein ETW24_19145 [Leisingera sp. NJS204]